jgi:hypothetical protein
LRATHRVDACAPRLSRRISIPRFMSEQVDEVAAPGDVPGQRVGLGVARGDAVVADLADVARVVGVDNPQALAYQACATVDPLTSK